MEDVTPVKIMNTKLVRTTQKNHENQMENTNIERARNYSKWKKNLYLLFQVLFNFLFPR